MMKNEDFKSLYKQVFDLNGNITACRREKCRELMVAANNVGDEEYGDLDFGRLYIDAVKRLYIKLFTT